MMIKHKIEACPSNMTLATTYSRLPAILLAVGLIFLFGGLNELVADDDGGIQQGELSSRHGYTKTLSPINSLDQTNHLTSSARPASTISSPSDNKSAQTELKTSSRMAISITQLHQEPMSGYLIKADERYILFEDNIDTVVHIIERTDFALLETNTNINLLSLMKDKTASTLTDIIELVDGSQIECLILDMSLGAVQYFTGRSLRREEISTKNISMLHFINGGVDIPFQNLGLSSLD